MYPRVLSVLLSGLLLSAAAAAQPPVFPTTGEGLYDVGCAKCHGVDGRGVNLDLVGFTDPLPDFTDCSFASREPDPDWIAVSHEGGPTRAFSRTMPAFGGAFSVEQLQLIIDHIRGFCSDDRWPRGDLNLPRPLITEKAFPEDEAVYTLSVNANRGGAVVNAITYEKRFGPRSMWEVVVPFGAREVSADNGWGNVGIGDLTVALKHAVHHDLDSGSIVSFGTEVNLPTGSQDQGLGTGFTRIEPFVSAGQLLPNDWFVQAFGGVKFSTDREALEHQAIGRIVLGRTLTTGQFGRSWSPMVEVLGNVALDDSSKVLWAVAPQMQFSLNQRQHVLLNAGARIPVNGDSRSTQIIVYVLWDWFDGGLLVGW